MTALGIRSSSPKACYVMSEDKCSVCKAYRRHMGKRYWGHSPTYHPTGMVMKKVCRVGHDVYEILQK